MKRLSSKMPTNPYSTVGGNRPRVLEHRSNAELQVLKIQGTQPSSPLVSIWINKIPTHGPREREARRPSTLVVLSNDVRSSTVKDLSPTHGTRAALVRYVPYGRGSTLFTLIAIGSTLYAGEWAIRNTVVFPNHRPSRAFCRCRSIRSRPLPLFGLAMD